jgi:LysR family glycine cleavage system transcriptional activator
MPPRPYDLPSLTTLAAFEAAARHASVKRAARELNVTPGAVSRQVKALETDLGVMLFTRVHRGLELTAEGMELAGVLGRGFAQAAETCRRLREKGDTPSLTLGASTAVAGLWLIPRIGRFWREHPEITVNHVISDEPADMRRGDVDLWIRYGQGPWRGETAVRLFGDRLFPVCGPGFAREHAAVTPEELPALPLLRLKGVDPGWPDWEDWLDWAGVRHGPLTGRSVNNYTILVQAARDDQGVALGWERLVRPLLERGVLTRLTDLAFDSPAAYFLTWPEDRTPSPAMELFRDWLLGAGLD